MTSGTKGNIWVPTDKAGSGEGDLALHSKQEEEQETAGSRVPREPLLERGEAWPVHQTPTGGWVGLRPQQMWLCYSGLLLLPVIVIIITDDTAHSIPILCFCIPVSSEQSHIPAEPLHRQFHVKRQALEQDDL